MPRVVLLEDASQRSRTGSLGGPLVAAPVAEPFAERHGPNVATPTLGAGFIDRPKIGDDLTGVVLTHEWRWKRLEEKYDAIS